MSGSGAEVRVEGAAFVDPTVTLAASDGSTLSVAQAGAALSAVSLGELRFTLPDGLPPGAVTVSVTTAAGTTTLEDAFVVEPPPPPLPRRPRARCSWPTAGTWWVGRAIRR